jgi:hypothetical protein
MPRTRAAQPAARPRTLTLAHAPIKVAPRSTLCLMPPWGKYPNPLPLLERRRRKGEGEEGSARGEKMEPGATTRRESSRQDCAVLGVTAPAVMSSVGRREDDTEKLLLIPDRAGGLVPRCGALGPRPRRPGPPHPRRPGASAIEPVDHALTHAMVSTTARPFSLSCAQQARRPSRRLSSVSDTGLHAVSIPCRSRSAALLVPKLQVFPQCCTPRVRWYVPTKLLQPATCSTFCTRDLEAREHRRTTSSLTRAIGNVYSE